MPRTRTVLVSALALLVMLSIVVLIDGVQPSAGASVTLSDARERLRRAVTATPFVHARTDADTYVVVFDANEAISRSNWPVTISLVAGGEWVLIYTTLLDREPGFVYPPALLRRALAYNATSAGAKFALDLENGDLDVQYEVPVRAVSGDVLRIAALDVAAACDEHFESFVSAVAPQILQK